MEVLVNMKYHAPKLLSKRHRIPRVSIESEMVGFTIKEFEEKDVKVAFITTDYGEETKYYLHDGRLWVKMKIHDHEGNEIFINKNEVERQMVTLAIDLPYYVHEGDRFDTDENNSWNRENKLKELKRIEKNRIIINDVLCEETGEPMYVYNTYGLGNNHGGTDISIVNTYNVNIPAKNYFNALNKRECVARAIEVATKRGDTNFIDNMGKNGNIEVLIPELVKRDPLNEHGEGNKIINSFNELINEHNTGDTFINGIMAINLLTKNIK